MLLKEVCEFRNGKAHEQYVDTDGQYILVTSKFISSDGKLYRRTNQQMTPLFRGDICMVMSDVPNGKALAKCFLVDEDNKYTLNQRIGSFTVDNRFDKKYFYYLMNRNKYFLSFNDGNGQTNLRKDDILKFTFDYIPIEDQHSIVQKLDKLKEIIEKRQHELQTLDDLIKARFVEMFGTIHNNQNDYEIKSLQDVCEPIKDGTHQTPKYTEDKVNGFKFLSSKDVTTGRINWDNIKYIPADLHEQLYARIQPEKGDVLLAKNGTTGIAAIVDRDEIFDIYVSLALLKPLNINSVYLWAAINSQETKEQFDASLKGIGVPNLHLGEIKKAKIIVPPIELQSKFADFVQEVDKSKVVVQKALDEAQLLFDSLMQEYFG